jgi:hypothetical protein
VRQVSKGSDRRGCQHGSNVPKEGLQLPGSRQRGKRAVSELWARPSRENAVLTHVMVDRVRAQMDPRILISYSHKDGSQFAASLRQQLLERNFSIWQDIVALEGRTRLVESNRRSPLLAGPASMMSASCRVGSARSTTII